MDATPQGGTATFGIVQGAGTGVPNDLLAPVARDQAWDGGQSVPQQSSLSYQARGPIGNGGGRVPPNPGHDVRPFGASRSVAPFTVEILRRPTTAGCMPLRPPLHGRLCYTAAMAWSVQAKRNVIGVVWMVGGMGLLVAAMMRNPLFLTALVVLAGVLFVATQRLTCPRCGGRVYPAGEARSGLLRQLPDACPHCGLKTTDRP